MRKYLLFLWVAIHFASIGLAQETGKEYYELKNKSKKPNITNVAIDFGLGLNFMSHLRDHEVGTLTYNGQTNSNDTTLEASRIFPVLKLALNVDFIESNKIYFGMGGIFYFSYVPYKVGSKEPDSYGYILYEKGHSSLLNYEVNTKFGIGSPNFKIYLGLGLGKTNIKSNYDGYSILEVNNIEFTHVYSDTIYYKLGYAKAMVGLRIGSNRKNVVDIFLYKWNMGDDFFVKTEKPSFFQSMTSFGKYKDQYPALPYGISASYTKTGKYKFEAEIQFFRDYDFIMKNANSFNLSIYKQINFHNHKKK